MFSDYICFFKLLPSYWVYCYAVVIVVCHVAAVFTLLPNQQDAFLHLRQSNNILAEISAHKMVLSKSY